MIDAIKAKFELTDLAEETLLLQAFAGHSGELDSKGRLCTRLNNLQLTYTPANRTGTVKGSLHTYAKGNNYTDLSRQELADAIQRLCHLLNLPPHRLQVLTLEAGANISLPIDAKPFLLSLYRYKGALFRELEAGQPYLQYRAGLTDYNVKLYNKSRYEGLTGCHLLRYEIQFRKSRAVVAAAGLPKGHILTLADIAKTDVLAALAAHLFNAWNMIDREQEMNTEGLKPAELKLLFAGRHPEYWQRLKKDTRKKERKAYNQIRRQATPATPCPVTAALKDKLREFLGNGFYTPFSPLVIIVKSGQIVGIEPAEETALQTAAKAA